MKPLYSTCRAVRSAAACQAVLLLALGPVNVACARRPQPPAGCVALAAADGPAGASLSVGAQAGASRPIGPEFFGFNLESTEFQLSLWDAKARRTRPEVVTWLREQFPGAVYRFPGGLVSNRFDWQAATGPVPQRRSLKLADWGDPYRVDFGLDEYRALLADVGGQGWYVANLRGSPEAERPVAELAGEAAALARRLRASGPRMLRWELGNELDRADLQWPWGKYVDRARVVVDAIRAADPDARFVGMLQDFDAQAAAGIRAPQYNRAVVGGLAPAGVVEYAQHYYYDDPPDGPPLPFWLNTLCGTAGLIDDAVGRTGRGGRDAAAPAGAADSSGAPAAPEPPTGVWITEHGRWPQERAGRPWRESWPRTADLDAALGVADLMIATSQIAQVRGTMVHALHGFTGPWPMFHPSPGGGMIPSAPMQAMAVLRHALAPRVLQAQMHSSRVSGYVGGYDVRAAVLADPAAGSFAFWAVNRHDGDVPLEIRVPALAGRHLSSRLWRLAGRARTDSNADGHARLQARAAPLELDFDAGGVARLVLPALSVSAVEPAVPSSRK